MTFQKVMAKKDLYDLTKSRPKFKNHVALWLGLGTISFYRTSA